MAVKFCSTGDVFEDDPAGSDEESDPPTSTPAQNKTPAEKKAKQHESFGALIDIERSNALLIKENLLLKQEKLKLQIALLQQQLANTSGSSNDPVYFNL